MAKKLVKFWVGLGLLAAGPSMATTVWNPAGNGIYPPAAGDWGEVANWNGGSGLPPSVDGKAVFNVADAAEARVTNVQAVNQFVQGDNGPGGVLRIAGTGDLSTGPVWSGVGYSHAAHVIVDAGGTMTFGEHMWVGFLPGATGTVEVAGTVVALGQFGLGWNGGVGAVHVLDRGRLDLDRIDPGQSIGDGSVLDIHGTGLVTIGGNRVGDVEAWAAVGKVRGNGQVGVEAVRATHDAADNVTTVVAISKPVDPPEATAPILSLRHLSDSIFELSWPLVLGSYVAEITNDLVEADAWTVVDTPVILSSNQFTQVITNHEALSFYRLNRAAVDNTSLNNKSMMGYQGWFSARGDGTQIRDRWHHWGGGYPDITSWGVDFFPDMSEYTEEERYDPGWVLPNGDPAYLFSAANPKTVARHCRWMWEYGIDGVFLQRFLSEIQDPRFANFRNRVTLNMKAGAEAYGRVFAIMYDISGTAEADLLGQITSDWGYLVGALGVTNSPAYARHNGKPVVTIWGLGFKSRSGTPAIATDIINYFKVNQGMTVMGGVPDGWRNLSGSSKTDPDWADVYRSFDIISPWTVGRYSSLDGADAWRISKTVPDVAAATAAGVDYMPVVFPGFSWHNIKPTSPLNQIPRLGGDFYWRQAYNCQRSGCSMLYTAMFDEMDEGTAMLKMAETPSDLPVGATMVPLDADGISLPSDWYLRVGGEAAKMLRGEIPLQGTLPLSP